MENQNPSVVKAALKYGALIAGLLILLAVIQYKFRANDNAALGWLEMLVIIGGLYWSMKVYREHHLGGFMEFGQGVGYGTLASLFGGSIKSIYDYIFFKYIDPSFLEEIKNTAYDKLMQSGSSDAELNMMEKIYEMAYTPGIMLIGGILSAVLGGVIISLILAATLKKSKPLFD